MVGGPRLSLLSKCFLGFLMFVNGVYSLAITGISLQTNSKQDDYVLHGEKATLTCQYHLSPGEIVTTVEWLKDDDLVFVWRNNLSPVAKGPFEGRVDLTNRASNIINITEAHMDMHGLMTCRISTVERKTEDSMKLIVIVDACPENSWTSHTDTVECTETITMRCAGIFPRPSPMCGIFNEKTQSFIRSGPFDSVKELKNGTFEVSFTRMYGIGEFVNLTDITFSCSIIIQDTTWKRGVKLKMFGDSGCPAEAPEIDNGYYNLTGGQTCWGTPGEETQALYTCEPGFNLDRTDKLICRNGSWVAEKVVGTNVIIKERLRPSCNKGTNLNNSLSILLLMIVSKLIFGFY